MPISQLYPENRPILSENFSKTKKISPELSYSRASIGTYIDSDGLIKSAQVGEPRFDHDPLTGEIRGLLVEEARTNLFRYSEQFDNAAWLNSGRSTQVPNTITSPDGTISADSCIVTGTGFNGNVTQSVSLTSGTTYTLTLYLKYKGFQFVRAGFGIGADFASFDLQSGLVAYTGSNVTTASISTFADGWYRCTVRYVAPSTGTYSVQFFPVDIVSNTYTTVSGTNGVYVWGAQLEVGAFPTSYIPTPATWTGRSSTATYYDSAGVIQTAASGVARSNAFLPDSSGVMRSAGLLLEEARTNLHTYSEQSDNAAWNKYGVTVTSNAVAAPDGTTTADKFASTAGATLLALQQARTRVAGTVYTVSVFAKSAEISLLTLQIGNTTEGTVFAAANLSAGTATNGGVMTKLPNGWHRISRTFTQESGTVGDFYLTLPANTVVGSGVFIWGAQLETGSFPTSYIPTVAATVTRSADTSTSTAVTRVADTLTIPVPPSTSSAQLTLKPSAVNSTSPLATFVGNSGALTSTSLELSTPLASPTIRALSKGIEQTRLVLPAPTNTALASATAQSLALTLNQSTGAMSLCSSTTDSTALSPIVELSATSGLKLAEPLTTMTIGPCGGLKSVYFWSTPLATNQLVTLANEQSAAGTTPRVSNGLPFEDLYVTANPAVNGRPTLDLNFAETKTLVDKITQTNLVTFTRASAGTYVGSDGLIKSAAVNEARFDHNPATGESLGLLIEESRTNEMSLSVIRPDNNGIYTQWTATDGASIVPYAELAPDGTFTAALVTFPQSVLVPRVSRQTTTASGARTVSVWLKAKSGTIQVRVGNNADFGATQTIGTQWTRVTYVVAGGSSNFAGIYCPPSQVFTEFYAWGFQQEPRSFVTSHIPTPATFTGRASTATFYDAAGVIQTAASGVARSNAFLPDSSGVMRPVGLLLEAAGTNLATYSESIQNWTPSGMAILPNAATSPANTLTAAKLVPAIGSNFTEARSNTFSVSGVVTFSCFLKDAGAGEASLRIGQDNTKRAQFNFSTGTVSNVQSGIISYQMQNVGNGWYRCSATALDHSGYSGIFVFAWDGGFGNGSDGVFAWGAQLEAGSFPTSYIPTTTATVTRAADTSTSATVTRSADVASITGTNFSSWFNYPQSTMYTEGVFIGDPYDGNYGYLSTFDVGTNDGSFYSRIRLQDSGDNVAFQSTLLSSGSTTGNVSLSIGANAKNTTIKQIHSITNATSASAAINGNLGTASISSNIQVPNRVQLGKHGSAYQTTCYLRRFAYWPTRLPDAQLQAITAAVSTWDVVFDSSIPIDGVCAIITTGIVTYTINWGDETPTETVTVATNITFTKTHKYSSPKFYVAKITVTSGAFRPNYSNSSYATHVIELRETPSGWTNTTTSGFGTNLQTAFANARNLRTISKDLNLSGITNLNTTWDGCSSLLNFPLLDTSGCTSLSVTWRNCSSLTSFPLINTSNVTAIGSVWLGCIGLTDFPLIDTSKVTNFSNAWFGCRGLIRFPLLNTSNVTDFTQAWDGGCIGLLSFPALDTSKGSLFAQTWRSCSSLTSFPFINTNSATTFANAWSSCTNLATFPANMFNTCTATNFTNAWIGCALTAQSIENILVSINTANTSNGTLTLSGGTNATKTTWTTAANTAYDALIARGWTITFRP